MRDYITFKYLTNLSIFIWVPIKFFIFIEYKKFYPFQLSLGMATGWGRISLCHIYPRKKNSSNPHTQIQRVSNFCLILILTE